MLVRESTPLVGQLILSRLSNCGVVNYKLMEATEEAARAAASPAEFSAVRS